MSENVVAKFGGTSMAQMEAVVNIAQASPEQQIIVASAPGKREPGDKKVTDLLISYAQGYNFNVREELMSRLEDLFVPLGSIAASNYSMEIWQDLKDNRKPMERIVSAGEYYSAMALAARLDAEFIDAADLFRFGPHGYDRKQTEQLIRARLADLPKGHRVVVPGFYGADNRGRTRLFDRGGSDRSGAILASTLGLTYQNWTDTDGIFSADPRIVPNPHVLPVLSREEVREGAHGGAGILQGDTIIDLNGSDVETVVRNTFNPAADGTRVVKTREATNGESVVAFSSRDDLTEITVRDMGMADAPGYVAHLLDYFGDLGLSVQHMPQAQDSFSITTVAKNVEAADAVAQFVAYAEQNLKTASGSVDISPKGVVYAVGEGLRDPALRTGAQIRLLGELAANDIAVEDVVTNRTSPSLALLVKPEDVKQVVQILHEREFGSRTHRTFNK